MDNSSFIGTFKEEAHELLSALESNLLELEKNPSDHEVLSAVFRAMHTIKGSAGMFGLDRISSFAHEVESILAALRDGALPYSKPIVDYTLKARDLLLLMLDDPDAETGDREKFLNAFRSSVGYCPEKKQASSGEKIASAEKAAQPAPSTSSAGESVWHIRFKPSPEILARGINPLLLLSELRSFGDASVIPDFSAIPTLSELDPVACVTAWDVFLTTTKTLNDIRDVFVFVEGSCELSIRSLSDMTDADLASTKKLGKILVDHGKLDSSVLESALGSQKRLGEVLVEQNLVSKTDVAVALQEQKVLQKCQKEKSISLELNTIRVKSEKLDALMALVGELVTVHARVFESTKHLEHSESLASIVELFGRLTDDLRSNTMSIRMVPVGSTFSVFKRLVRDLSGELGKQVELETAGGETELDKSVIEKLQDPLVHIIRNSLDHGIESPEVRKEREKNETGIVRLSAVQAGAFVYITVEDDGNGLDRGKILKKAIAKGLVRQDQSLSDEEVFRLTFLPGFSTKDVATSVSGRGVGMDVVNKQMELIGGSVEISSEQYKGTKITLKIPLTLAIIDGLLVKVSGEYFIIPLSLVEGCMEFSPADRESGSRIVIHHGHQVPFISLRDYFGVSGERSSIEQLVIVTVKNENFALLVDHILGANQTVIKPLDKIYKRARGISSATIRGDGSIALILDIEEMLGSSV